MTACDARNWFLRAQRKNQRIEEISNRQPRFPGKIPAASSGPTFESQLAPQGGLELGFRRDAGGRTRLSAGPEGASRGMVSNGQFPYPSPDARRIDLSARRNASVWSTTRFDAMSVSPWASILRSTSARLHSPYWVIPITTAFTSPFWVTSSRRPDSAASRTTLAALLWEGNL